MKVYGVRRNGSTAWFDRECDRDEVLAAERESDAENPDDDPTEAVEQEMTAAEFAALPDFAGW
jgi:hypothetical protein